MCLTEKNEARKYSNFKFTLPLIFHFSLFLLCGYTDAYLNPLKLMLGDIESMLSLSFSFRTRSKSSNKPKGSFRSRFADRSMDSKLFSRPLNASGSISSTWQWDRSKCRICDSLWKQIKLEKNGNQLFLKLSLYMNFQY